MDTGMRLKYHRMKKKMSLEDLASGILLPKELKKIEAGLKEPGLKELEALCKRLEISLAPKDNPVGKVLVKNFKSSLLHPQNKAKIMEHYADIHDHPLLHSNEDIELEYNIQQVRFFIITGDLDSAEDKMKDVERFKEFMSQEQFYLFHKYMGNYQYIIGDYEQAIKTYLLSERIAPTSISNSELGDLFYSIGLSATQLWEIHLGIKYSELALKIYQQEFVPKRIVECHLLIANNARRLSNFKTAKEHYKNAFNIGIKIDNDQLKFTTEYNYGYFYFQFQKYEEAIKHLENALKYIPKEFTSDILLNYCTLIKCYLEVNDLNAVEKRLHDGHKIIKEKNLSLDTPSNNQFKEIYIEFVCLNYFINGEIESFETYFLKNLLPVLKSHNKYFEIGFYYNHLGNTYLELENYKKASFMLKNSSNAYKHLLHIAEE
ncbi:helix-turn-helix domain-containing protein [Planomicrobium okeanokoites]|uniref:helix-turn-helix domain-containing protein n=1 Tax=Planomicrobium okeanokoites TaxID=244 RepID=UPI00249229EE|nr:helix-turn-helix domain-containing protein [Planomicrobium okeanokoites]